MFRQTDRNGYNIGFSENPREWALYEGDNLIIVQQGQDIRTYSDDFFKTKTDSFASDERNIKIMFLGSQKRF